MKELDKEKLIEYYNKGITYVKMAELLDTSLNNIYINVNMLLKDNVISKRKWSHNKPIEYNKNMIISDYKNGLTDRKRLSEIYGVSLATVEQYLKGYKIRKKYKTCERTQQIIEDIKKNELNLSEIARKYNVSRQWTCEVKRKYNL